MRPIIRLFAAVCLTVCSIGTDSSAAVIRLEHADSSSTTQIPGGNIYEFFGDVHFVRDSADLFSQYVAMYDPGNLVRLCGKVQINEPSRSLVADSVWYYQKGDSLHAWDRWRLRIGTDMCGPPVLREHMEAKHRIS
jgi:hypothetical protein